MFSVVRFSSVIGFLLVLRVGAMDINEFFPDINGNLTKITWAHAVNNKTLLTSALNSPVMMLEADVIYGKLNGKGEPIPIMGHPPANQSDLSLEDFLTTTYTYNEKSDKSARKGVKLDFKSTEVFLKSIASIEKLYSSIDYPIWINADIVKGPLSPQATPVDASKFLEKAKIFEKSVLSLGWTTSKPEPRNVYTDEQIGNMVDFIKKSATQQDITFAVRAGIAAQSLGQMKQLKSKIDNCTLTIWSSPEDAVDVPKLRDVIFDFGVKRVYVDVPEELREKLDLGNAASAIYPASALLAAVYAHSHF